LARRELEEQAAALGSIVLPIDVEALAGELKAALLAIATVQELRGWIDRIVVHRDRSVTVYALGRAERIDVD